MNYYYSRSDEVEADLKLALTLDDDAFEKEFQFDREDREVHWRTRARLHRVEITGGDGGVGTYPQADKRLG